MIAKLQAFMEFIEYEKKYSNKTVEAYKLDINQFITYTNSVYNYIQILNKDKEFLCKEIAECVRPNES